MSKVYLLTTKDLTDKRGREPEIIGILSHTHREAVKKWINNDPEDSSTMRRSQNVELDDPELLNRIAKEGENK